MKSSKKVFGRKTNHVRHIHLKRDKNSNEMERLNGTIRDREKTFRGLDNMPTPVFEGMKVHYNHVRRHDTICRTPAEAAGISTEGSNKWKTIIQNSSLNLIATDQRV